MYLRYLKLIPVYVIFALLNSLAELFFISRYLLVGHFSEMLCHHHQESFLEQNLIHIFLASHICKDKKYHTVSI